MLNGSATRPPRTELFELDLSVAVLIDRREGGVDLSVRVANPQRVEQFSELGLVDRAVAVVVDAVEAVAQRIRAHSVRLRRFRAPANRALLALLCALLPCCNVADPPKNRPFSAPPAAVEPHPVAVGSDGDSAVIVTPPVGTVAPARLIVAVHGAGDRPEWACGGWRLASQASAFVVCPQGSKLTSSTFAWPSPELLAARVSGALSATRARYEHYIDAGPLIYAGFSQGATFAEAFLRQNAGRFPIAILAEGGYATARSSAFAAAFRAAGGRRVVLVCGSPACFRSALSARKVLERANLEVLVVGDEKAGHNLNERMQHALQSAWPEISAPLH